MKELNSEELINVTMAIKEAIHSRKNFLQNYYSLTAQEKEYFEEEIKKLNTIYEKLMKDNKS